MNADYECLNPEYQNFIPGESYIKFETYYDVFFRDRIDRLKFLLPIAVVAAILGFASFIFSWESASINVETTGKVESCEPWGNGGILTYSYSVPTGRGYSNLHTGRYASDKSGRVNCDKLTIGMPLDIRYHPQNPFQSKVIDQSGLSQLPFAGIVMTMLLGFATVMLFSWMWEDVRQIARYYRIYRRFHKVSSPIIGRATGYSYSDTIGYEFISPDGTKCRGEQRVPPVTSEHRRLLVPGSPVLVLYEAEDCHLIL